MSESLEHSYRSVLDRTEAACRRCGRSPQEVTLVAVSKTFPVRAVEELHALGHVDFGENKTQELSQKAEVLPGQARGGSLRWHAIGHLQRNKVKDVVAHADVFHALDSMRLAAELDRRLGEAGRALPCLVQVNISGEGSKSGIAPSELDHFLGSLSSFEHLEVRGLMTLASPAEDPEEVRSEFREMRRLLVHGQRLNPDFRLEWLSMGMSGDYEVAVEEGATHVRVGSAIFGARSYP